MKYHLRKHIVLGLLLRLLVCSNTHVSAQETVDVEFAHFKILNGSNSFLDSNSRNWTKVNELDELPSIKKQYLLHKDLNPLSLSLEFSEKLSFSQAAKISCIWVQHTDTIFLATKLGLNNSIKLNLQNPKGQFEVVILYNNLPIASLEIDVYALRQEKIYIVPILPFEINEKELEQKINTLFYPLNLSFTVELLPEFYVEELEGNSILDNPSSEFDHYTQQMRRIRDAYFESFPRSDKRAYYVFIHQGFINESILSYTVKGKAIAFIKNQEIDDLANQIAIEMARGIGSLKTNSTLAFQNNLMDKSFGNLLNAEQWRKLHLEYRSYSFYDNDEDISTFNGFIAYYFWEENEDGTIVFNPGAFRGAIQRPYKKNYFSYNLSVEKRLVTPIFFLGKQPITWLHFILLSLYFGLAYWLRKKFERRLSNSIQKWFHVKVIVARFTLITLVSTLTFVTFFTINKTLAKYEIYEGRIPEFSGLNYEQIENQILYNEQIDRSQIPEMATEVLIKTGNEWHVKRRKRVLYFDLHQDSVGTFSIARFNRESDSIILPDFNIRMLAPSHYFVVNRINSSGAYESQQIYNHQGANVTQKLSLEQAPAKRILLFVNGYRPTSLGSSLEENFRDIRERGVEFPDSKNMIYNFDRYDYWRPWREIDLKLIKRINPSETFYADGHFSVSTSNYRSLLKFTEISTNYPSRCKDPNNHVCLNQGKTSWFQSSDKSTGKMLPTQSNFKGFKKREDNGRLAGLNLLQQLNEIPNSSDNDTLYIVAHSMGYAYALGMIGELRGKINFGGFYIIAPENASAGRINMDEWQEVWQYGVNHQKLKDKAPCLLDGIAPQTKVTGLVEKHHIFIPDELYKRFGFFDSHFIGFYDWILDLKDKQPGAIKQR